MCGIGGIINNPAIEPAQAESVFKSILHSRGPDHFGTFRNERFHLFHSRLKIIDLSDEANQPMRSQSGNSILVFNGEVYNFKAIRDKYQLNCKTSSDTEVILEAIEKVGLEEVLPNLEGMFAFCFVDLRSNQLSLARDRFGQKPLYYFKGKKDFGFSSDIRVFSELFKEELSMNHNSIAYQLVELSSPQPNSIWNEVQQVRPGHFMTFDTNGSTINEKRYWSLSSNVFEGDEQAALTKVEDSLLQALSKRTISDVPLGCFLSGGIDSGLLVSMLASNSNERLKTFTVGFEYDEFSETKAAQFVAQKYNTDHTEIILNPSLQGDIENILDAFGEPFADSSAIPSYYISKAIKDKVSVAISGDGGDELFGGYIDYGYAWRAEQFQSDNQSQIQQKLKGLSSKITSRLFQTPNFGTELDYLSINDPWKLNRGMAFEPNSSFLSSDQNQFIEAYFGKIWNSHKDHGLANQLMRASLETRLLNDYLVKVDRASMAHALEVRSPFLDHDLAELAFSIPLEIKMKGNANKHLLKQIAVKYLGEEHVKLPKKGFEIPIKKWLKSELFDFAKEMTTSFDNRGMYGGLNTSLLLDEHRSSKADHTHKLWAIISLENWLKKHSD